MTINFIIAQVFGAIALIALVRFDIKGKVISENE